MRIRAITIGGEYGSGREEIGRLLAEKLGWKLVDKSLIDEIARAAHVEPDVARRFDETVDPWLHRMQKALWHGGYEGVVSTTEAGFDADAMAAATRPIIEQAAKQGQCVIVGRGAQCVLQQHDEVFHVFVYGPRKERIERVRRHDPGRNAEALVEEWDQRRAQYIRRYFGCDWTNRHLFDLMVCSSMGEEAAAAAVVAAVGKYKPG